MTGTTCNTAINTAALSIESNRFFQSLEFAFAKSSSIIGELMQNARRAKASEVRLTAVANDGVVTLTFSDDGIGIRDFTTLLRVGSSGWDEETMDTESPYGLGFLACLYACKHLAVTSDGLTLRADTDHLLRQLPVSITGAPAPMWGSTRVVLHGLRMSLREVCDAVVDFAKGFPLPVHLNGKELERPDAVTTRSERFVETEVGSVSVKGITHAIGCDPKWVINPCLTLYLQGLPIVQTQRYRETDEIVIHLDQRRFTGRWPDRAVLNNPDKAVAACRDALVGLTREFLVKQRSEIGEAAYVARFWDTFQAWKPVADLFTDLEKLHWPMLVKPCYPRRSRVHWDGDSGLQTVAGRTIDKAALDAGDVVLVDLEDEFDPELNALSWMAAYAGEKVVAVSNGDALPEWARQRIVREDDLEVRIDGDRRDLSFSYHHVMEDVVLCESYRIVIAKSEITLATITSDAAFVPLTDTPDGTPTEGPYMAIVCPERETSGQVVEQVTDFCFDEQFDEDDANAEAAAFARMLLTERGDPCAALAAILRESQAPNLGSLFNKRFSIIFDERGSVSVIESTETSEI